MTKRIDRNACCGVLIDVQGFFLSQIDKRLRSRIATNTKSLVSLLGYFRAPIVITLERPVEEKGFLPKEIQQSLDGRAQIFEKDFFDLTREKKIRDHLASLKKKQVIIAGCETDVCVLQSCLGLLSLGYEVYAVEELLFSSARNTEGAIARMKTEGAVFLSYKTLYYELVEAVDSGQRATDMQAQYGARPPRK